MFGIDSAELLIVAIVALVVIGPKDLPRVLRTVGNWVAKARGMARHFRTGMDTMIRESELEEMQKKWASDNDRIMREHPMPPADAEADANAAVTPPPPAFDPPPAPPVTGRPRPPAPPRRTAPPPPRRDAPPAPPRDLP